jgi:hypothetical protein
LYVTHCQGGTLTYFRVPLAAITIDPTPFRVTFMCSTADPTTSGFLSHLPQSTPAVAPSR